MGRRNPLILDTGSMGTVEKLEYEKRAVSARWLEQRRLEGIVPPGFEDFLDLMIDEEITVMNSKKLDRIIKQAHLPFPSAHMSTIYEYPGRPLDMALLRDLSHCEYIRQGQNVIISGSSGSGKTFLASGLARCACEQGYRALYTRMSDFLYDLALAYEQKRHMEFVSSFNKRYDLLVMDEWLTRNVSSDEIYHLLDFLDSRCGTEKKKSIIFCSLFPVKDWYPRLVQSGADAVGGESILDRIVHNSNRVTVSSDQSMRLVLSDLQTQSS